MLRWRVTYTTWDRSGGTTIRRKVVSAPSAERAAEVMRAKGYGVIKVTRMIE